MRFVLCNLPLGLAMVLRTLGPRALGIFPYDLVLAALVVGGIDLAFGLVIRPYLVLLDTLLYYDLRARKESRDAEILAPELGYEPPGKPSPSSGS